MNDSSAKYTIEKYCNDIIKGQLILDVIPSPPADTIRVFLSSTATDFTDERSAIWLNVSPRIRDWTRAKYGLEFQLIDLHWEDRPEVSEDQLTFDFIQQELQYCHQTSLGPCFVGLIGQKYGRQPLPVVINQDEFETIRTALSKHISRDTRDADILYRYFLLDTNNIPPIYRLVPAGDNITSAAPVGGRLRALQDDEKLQFCQDLSRVRFLLQKGSEFAVADGTMEAQTAEKFSRSVLDHELKIGLGESADVDKRCLIFIRTIVDLAEQAERGSSLVIPTIKRYAELLESNSKRLKNGAVAELSPSSQQMLDLLRDNLIEVRLPRENIKQAKVVWRFDKGICPDIYTHKRYLEQLCDLFYSTIIHMIKENVGMAANIPTEPNGTHERFKWDALHSWYLVQQFFISESLYIGYDFQLENIRNYVREGMDSSRPSTAKNRLPLIICGAPGSGKSSLIARLAMESRNWISGCSIVVRFCGMSSASNSLLFILDSVCRQLEAIIAEEDFTYSSSLPPCEDLLIAQFWRLLTSIPKKSSVVLLFDGIDRMDPPYPGWLPPTLPNNVSVIATVTATSVAQAVKLCGLGGILPEENILELPGLAPEDASELINMLLESKHRRLTIDQNHTFCQLIEFVASSEESGCLAPLYVSILAGIAETYASDQETPETNMSSPLPQSLFEAIDFLFEKLEIAHGFSVVSAIFSLLSAADCALTDCEIEDILSLDEAFMAVLHKGDIYQALKNSTTVPIRRAPPVLWIRLRSDLKRYILATWEHGGQTAWWWRHSSFAAAAKQRYLQDHPEAMRRLHSRLADYWLGPNENMGEGETSANTVSRGNTAVTSDMITRPARATTPNLQISQPVILQKFGYKTHNVRKLKNLPLQLAGAERFIELAGHCLFSYEWIYHKTCALGLSDVILDYNLATKSPNPLHSIEAALVAEALRDIGKSIDFGVILGDTAESPKKPAAINCLPTELSSRLLPYIDTSENIRSLVIQCDLLGLDHNALVPILPHPNTPGAALLAEMTFRPDGKNVNPDCLKLVETPDDQILLFAKSIPSKRIGCFQLPIPRKIGNDTGSSSHMPLAQPWDVDCSSGKMFICPELGLVAIVDPTTNRAIKFHDFSSGAYYGQLIPTPTEKNTHSSENKDKTMSIIEKIRPASLQKTEILAVEMEAGMLYVAIHPADSDFSEIQIYNLRDCPDGQTWNTNAEQTCNRWVPEMFGSVVLPGKAAFMKPSPTGQSVFCGVGTMLCIASVESQQVEFILPAPGRVHSCISSVDENCVMALCSDDASVLVLSDHQRFSAVEALTSDGAKIHFEKLKMSPNDTYVAVWNKGLIDLLSSSSAKQLNRLVNPFAAPPTSEGLVANQSLSEMHSFAELIFTPNEDVLIASAGRWLLLWKPISGEPIARLQAELGIIDCLISAARGRLLVSHVKKSAKIQVWNLELGTPSGHSEVPGAVPPSLPTLPAAGIDHLPGTISELSVVGDGQLAYAKLEKSSIVGVFSMSNGRLVRALEHDANVVSLVPVMTGQYCLVSTADNQRANAANRLWDVVESRVLWRFGNDPGQAVALKRSDGIIHIARMTEQCTIHDPYTVFLYKFQQQQESNSRFEVIKLHFEVRYVLSKPFITENDSRCVFLVADSYDHGTDVYGGRTICVCDISKTGQNESGTPVAMFGVPQLCDFVNVTDIVGVQESPQSPSNVIVLYKSAASRQGQRNIASQSSRRGNVSVAQSVASMKTTDSFIDRASSILEPPVEPVTVDNGKSIGFLVLDVSTGTVLRCCDHFLTPDNLPLKISPDLHCSIDNTGAMFDLVTCQMKLSSIHERNWPFMTFINDGKLAVYGEPDGGSNRLQVIRTSDCKLVGWVRLWAPIKCATTFGRGEAEKLAIGLGDGSFTAYSVVDRQILDTSLQQHLKPLESLLPNRTKPVAYAQNTELVQLFSGGRQTRPRLIKTAPLLLYKEGKLVAPASGSDGKVQRLSGSASSSMKQRQRSASKPKTPPMRPGSGLSASTVSYARSGMYQQYRPRDFRSAACNVQ